MYATVADLRAEGLSASYQDPACLRALQTWTQFIDRVTGQFFEPRALTLDLDGSGSGILRLPVPIIKVDALYVNSDFDTPFDPTRYVVYNDRGPGADDRRNPRIKMVAERRSIFDPPYPTVRGYVFNKGQRNQRIVGTFGFTEPSSDPDILGVPPALIRRALLWLTLDDLLSQKGVGIASQVVDGPQPSGALIQETADAHSTLYDTNATNKRKIGTKGITGSEEIDAILNLYKAPFHVTGSSTGDWR